MFALSRRAAGWITGLGLLRPTMMAMVVTRNYSATTKIPAALAGTATTAEIPKNATRVLETDDKEIPLVPRCRIKITGYDYEELENFMEACRDIAKVLQIIPGGIARLPTKKKIYAVRRSPFAHSLSGTHFVEKTHRRAIVLYNASPKSLETFVKYISLKMDGNGFAMRIDEYDYIDVPTKPLPFDDYKLDVVSPPTYDAPRPKSRPQPIRILEPPKEGGYFAD